MISPDPSLEPDWDDDNVEHVAAHGLQPEQVEELYYNDGPFQTLALKNKKGRGRGTEYRYRIWGTDADGSFIEAVIAPYPDHGVRRCVTAYPMSVTTKQAYLQRIKR